MSLHGINYLGLVLLAVGTAWLIRSAIFAIITTRTKGTILRYLMRDGRTSEGPTYSPVFQYHDYTGEEHTVTAKWGTCPVPYKVGQQVDILYRKQSPHIAKIHNLWFFYWIPIVVVFAGFYFIQTE